MKKYRINHRKIKRNLIIIAFIILSIFYFNNTDKKTNENIKSCQAFSEYAKEHNIAQTQDNYKKFINK